MKDFTLFKRTPSQHQSAVQDAHNYINNMVSEETLSSYSGKQVSFVIDTYHAQNQELTLEAFALGLNEKMSNELRSICNASQTPRFVF